MAYTYKPNKIATYKWFNQLTGYTVSNTDNKDNTITYNNLKNETNKADYSDLGIIPSIPAWIDGTKCAKESYIYSLFKHKEIVVNCDVKNITLGDAKNHHIKLYAYLPNTDTTNDAAQLPIKISVTIEYSLNDSTGSTIKSKTVEMTIPKGSFNISYNVDTNLSNGHIDNIYIKNVTIISDRYVFNPNVYATQHIYNVIIGKTSITSAGSSTTVDTYDFKSVINSFKANSTNINPDETNTYDYEFTLSYYKNNASYNVSPTDINIEFENSNTYVTDDVINSLYISPSASTRSSHTFYGKITLKAADNVNGMINFPKIFATVSFSGYKIKKLILFGSI